MKNVLFIFFLPLWVFLTSITFAADFQAKVIHIADGDTPMVKTHIYPSSIGKA